MIFLLCLMAFLLLGISYLLSKKNLFSPMVIACCTFCISIFCAMLYHNKWIFYLEAETVIIIMIGIISFCLGECMITYASEKKRGNISKTGQSSNQNFLQISSACTILLSMIILLMAGIYYIDLKRIVAIGQIYDIEGSFLYIARSTQLSQLTSIKWSVGHISLFSKSVSYLFAYIFLHQCIWYGIEIKRVLLLLPIICNIPIMIFSTGRTEILFTIIAFFIMAGIIYQQKHNWNIKNNFKFVIWGLAALAFYFLVFILAGTLRGASYLMGITDTLALYTGMSIPALNEVIIHPFAETAYIGDHTFIPFYSTLNSIGFDLPVLMRHAEFTELTPEYSTNIYTALYRYLRDFGYGGMLIIMFFLGALYSLFFLAAKAKQGLTLILYATYFYPVPMLSIDELFFSDVLSTEKIYLLCYICILYYFIIFRKKRAKIPHDGGILK